MNKIKTVILVLVGVILLAGCTMTSYHKTVVVEKDGEGKIIKSTITEGIIQPNRSEPVEQDKYLDM
ncbi:MAG: hypothetical protein ACYDFR_03740 [Candidatus Omnitrophota bacterium]